MNAVIVGIAGALIVAGAVAGVVGLVEIGEIVKIVGNRRIAVIAEA